MKITDKEKILRYLIHSDKVWHSVSNSEGSAKLSALAIHDDMIETDKKRKKYKYRFRFENTFDFLNIIPVKMSAFVREELLSASKSYEIRGTESKFDDEKGVMVVKDIIRVVRRK